MAVKDAKGDLTATSWVTRRCDLAIYSGDDKNTLPLLAVGAVGVVGVPHLTGLRTKAMIEAFERGDVTAALAAHHALLPVFDGFFRTQGVILTKAALRLAGLPAGPVRPPLVNATEAEVARVMGLPSPWPESKEMFGNSCLTCHAAIRTNRHQVTYLKAEAIEAAGQKNADVCYGCHGGRSWYRMEYPYPRHPWEGMSPEVPDWAKDRPVVSEARFALPANGNQPKQ